MRELGRICQSGVNMLGLQCGVAAQDFRLGGPFSEAVENIGYQHGSDASRVSIKRKTRPGDTGSGFLTTDAPNDQATCCAR
jgi:hypothetical protein